MGPPLIIPTPEAKWRAIRKTFSPMSEFDLWLGLLIYATDLIYKLSCLFKRLFSALFWWNCFPFLSFLIRPALCLRLPLFYHPTNATPCGLFRLIQMVAFYLVADTGTLDKIVKILRQFFTDWLFKNVEIVDAVVGAILSLSISSRGANCLWLKSMIRSDVTQCNQVVDTWLDLGGWKRGISIGVIIASSEVFERKELECRAGDVKNPSTSII